MAEDRKTEVHELHELHELGKDGTEETQSTDYPARRSRNQKKEISHGDTEATENNKKDASLTSRASCDDWDGDE